MPAITTLGVDRGRRKGLLVVRYRLANRSPTVLLVRGPGPGCDVVARTRLRGRLGLNRLVLPAPRRYGAYLLSARTAPGGRDLERILVRLPRPGADGRGLARPRCGKAASSSLRQAAFTIRAPRPPAARPKPRPLPKSASQPRDVRLAVVRPAAAAPLPAPDDGVSTLSVAGAIALLVALALSLVGILVSVVRALRPAPDAHTGEEAEAAGAPGAG